MKVKKKGVVMSQIFQLKLYDYETEIKKRISKSITDNSEKLYKKYLFDESEVNEVEVESEGFIGEPEEITKQGVYGSQYKLQYEIKFKGNAGKLLIYEPSPYTILRENPQIRNNSVIFTYIARNLEPDELERIKQQAKTDTEKYIKKNLENLKKDLSKFNNAVKQHIDREVSTLKTQSSKKKNAMDYLKND